MREVIHYTQAHIPHPRIYERMEGFTRSAYFFIPRTSNSRDVSLVEFLLLIIIIAREEFILRAVVTPFKRNESSKSCGKKKKNENRKPLES